MSEFNQDNRISVSRFIAALDRCFLTNDLDGADRLIEQWRQDATEAGDDRALLTIDNEGLGLYRRTSNYDKAMRSVQSVKNLIEKTQMDKRSSGATAYVNLATTLKAFGKPNEALEYYRLAENVYINLGLTDSYEYSALLNNRSSAYSELKEYDMAEADLIKAVEILKKHTEYDGQIAVALVNLAHVVYDRSDQDTDRVEALLDEAWEYLNSKNLVKDGEYAFIISKCAPSLRYFNRFDEADALEYVAQEIYGGNK